VPKSSAIELSSLCFPRKVFLDVGVNEGQTLDEVARPDNLYEFDEVHAFEPSTKHVKLIMKKFAGRLFLHFHNFGFSNVTEDGHVLYSSGHLGGTLIKDVKSELPDSEQFVKLVDVTEWINVNLRPGCDFIFLKINCEGCELWIIPSLVHSNIFKKLTWVHLDFDVRKHASTATAEIHLRSMVKNFTNWEDPTKMRGSIHQERIRSWLCRQPKYFPKRC
jgi:FkbM family methyltransferase